MPATDEEILDIRDPLTEEPIRLRRIRPDDAPRLQAFHLNLSPQVVHLRFHGYLRELPHDMAQRFCEVDGHDRVAWVAVSGDPLDERIVGVGRFDRLEKNTAEVAFVVANTYEHLGIGSVLLNRLVSEAQPRGISVFVARLLPGNTPMRKLLQRTGYPLRTDYGDGAEELWLALPASE